MDNTEIEILKLKMWDAKLLNEHINRDFPSCQFDIRCFEKYPEISTKVLVTGLVVKIILTGHEFYDYPGNKLLETWVTSGNRYNQVTYTDVIKRFHQIGLFSVKRLALVGFEVVSDNPVPSFYSPIPPATHPPTFRAIWA